MTDQYGLAPEDYVGDLKSLSNARCAQCMSIFTLQLSKQRLKQFQDIVIPLMAYDFIYHIPQQVRLSICKQ